MTVYVDPLFDARPYALKAWPFDKAYHMTADSVKELHEFAIKLGLRRAWFQHYRLVPHDDLTPNKRRQAIGLEAVPINEDQMADRVKAAMDAKKAEPRHLSLEG